MPTPNPQPDKPLPERLRDRALRAYQQTLDRRLHSADQALLAEAADALDNAADAVAAQDRAHREATGPDFALPETAYDRAVKAYQQALDRAVDLAAQSEAAWDGADRYGQVVTYADSGVPCHEVAAMYAQQAQAWAAIAVARAGSLYAGGA